jgi:hypothetical protein
MAPTVRSSAGHGSSAAASSHNVPLPTGYQAGDLLILGLQYRQSVTANAVSGWTQIATLGATSPMTWWRRQADGGEGSTVTVSFSGSTNISGGTIAITTGTWDTAAPINQNSTNNGTSTSATANAITPNVNDTLLIYLGGAVGSGLTMSTPSPMSLQWTQSSTDSTNNAVAVMATEAGPSSGVSTGTRTSTVSGSSDWKAFLLAVAPSTAGGNAARADYHYRQRR